MATRPSPFPRSFLEPVVNLRRCATARNQAEEPIHAPVTFVGKIAQTCCLAAPLGNTGSTTRKLRNQNNYRFVEHMLVFHRDLAR